VTAWQFSRQLVVTQADMAVGLWQDLSGAGDEVISIKSVEVVPVLPMAQA
jgi:hypothetical protein